MEPSLKGNEKPLQTVLTGFAKWDFFIVFSILFLLWLIFRCVDCTAKCQHMAQSHQSSARAVYLNLPGTVSDLLHHFRKINLFFFFCWALWKRSLAQSLFSPTPPVNSSLFKSLMARNWEDMRGCVQGAGGGRRQTGVIKEVKLYRLTYCHRLWCCLFWAEWKKNL